MQVKTITAALTIAAISAALFLCCGKAQRPRPPEPIGIGAESPFASFRDIPGVTVEEIADIEALQKKRSSFVYGMPPNSEAFLDAENNGGVRGFSALFCEWLTGLFQISFNPALYAWSDMIGGLERREIDFTGDLMATEERRASYLMTDAIAVRALALFRISGAPPISKIAGSRPPRFAFLKNSAAFAAVNAVAEMPFDPVFVSGFPEAYEALASGEADAFISAGISEASFIAYGDVVSEVFFPMVYNSVSLSTQNPELAPVVSVVQKALRHSGARHYLAGLYQAGNNEYRRHKLFTLLSEEERAYLRSAASVPMVARYFNYPVDFYNTYEKKWDGLVFDVLREVEKLTGLAFVVVNGKNANLTELYEMVRVGEAHIVPEMIISNERKEHYIWTEHKFIADQYALLSKSHLPNVSVGEIPAMRVGVIKNTVRAGQFLAWFPNAESVTEYETDEDAMFAVERDEVDMVMSSKNRMISYLNYYGLSDYKANYLFSYPYEAAFGINKDQAALCSIVDKALSIINTDVITEQWMTRTYDYKKKLMEARLPWLIGATVLSLTVLTLVLVLFFRNLGEEKRLEILVQRRTAEIEQQRKLLEYMSLTDQLTGLPNRRNFDMRLDIEWQLAIREKQSISLLMVDIDHFKEYNDMYGHQQGDEVLRIIAKIIEQTPKRPGDFVARWGGEEFAVLLSNTDTDGALKIAEAIRANVEKTKLLVNGSVAKLTVSIGANTQAPTQGSPIETFISGADKELYKAKEAGRNKVCCFSASSPIIVGRLKSLT